MCYFLSESYNSTFFSTCQHVSTNIFSERMMIMNIEVIKELCKSREMSVYELERQLDFGRGCIGKWAGVSPSYDKVVKVANYFNVSMDYICGNTDNPEPPDSSDQTIVCLQRFKKNHPDKTDKIDQLIQSTLKLLDDQ